MSRGGASKDRADGPERKCIATGEARPKHGLVRFVADPEGRVVPDIMGKLPGRGVYVAADRRALDRAIQKKLFARVTTPMQKVKVKGEMMMAMNAVALLRALPPFFGDGYLCGRQTGCDVERCD